MVLPVPDLFPKKKLLPRNGRKKINLKLNGLAISASLLALSDVASYKQTLQPYFNFLLNTGGMIGIISSVAGPLASGTPPDIL